MLTQDGVAPVGHLLRSSCFINYGTSSRLFTVDEATDEELGLGASPEDESAAERHRQHHIDQSADDARHIARYGTLNEITAPGVHPASGVLVVLNALSSKAANR